nr:MAG TPA: DnaB-like replicative helicase [Caudoviricetes sp.]
MNAHASQSKFIVEIECEVLGTLLANADYRKVADILEPIHFIEPIHREIFKSIIAAHEQYANNSMPIVLKLIDDDVALAFEQAAEITLSQYMAKLVATSIYGPASLDKTAKRVVLQWARLSIAKEASNLHVAAVDPSSKPDQLVIRTGIALDDILAHVRRGIRRKSQVSIAGAVANALSDAKEAAIRGNGLTGITWGLADVNRATGGIQRRDLTLIGARPSMGKTTLGLSTALKCSAAGAATGFISLEMDSAKLGARALTDLAYDWNVKVPYQDVITGRASRDDLEALENAAQELERLPLLIEEQPGLSITDIRVKLEGMLEYFDKLGKRLDVLMIDHLGLIRASSRYAGNRNNEISEMTSALKSMAREYDIGVVALSQLSRAVESRDNKRPQLSDLRDSGAIEQDADMIAFLYREAYYLDREKGGGPDKEAERIERLIDCQNKLEFMIAKQRNGPVKEIDLFIDVACSAVRSSARN